MNKKVLFLLILLVISFGCTTTEPVIDNDLHSYDFRLNIIDGNTVLFSGLFGSDEETNAFDAVKISLDNNLEYAEYDFGVFITSILGVTPKENEFWSLYINGEKATMGISSYNNSDVNLIEFKLEELQTFE